MGSTVKTKRTKPPTHAPSHFAEGIEAYERGVKRTGNPYMTVQVGDLWKRDAWFDGWDWRHEHGETE